MANYKDAAPTALKLAGQFFGRRKIYPMRKLGFILLILGFIWVTFITLEAVPVAHALNIDSILKKPQQQSYTRNEVVEVSSISKYTVAHFAMWGFVGGLLMFAGGIILAKAGNRNSDKKPPIL